jgi:hypothetical protein
VSDVRHAFETPGPVGLRISFAAGRLDVETGPEGRTEIEVTPLNRAAQDVVEELAVRVDQAGGRYDVVVEEPKKWGFLSNAEIGVRVRCPQDTALELKTASADAVVRGPIESAHAKTASGDLSFGEVLGELVVNSQSGDVKAGDVDGDCTIKTASGDVRVHRVAGAFVANLVSGDLHLSEAQGPVTVQSVSGDQWLGSIAAGEVRLQSVSGDVRVGVRPGLRLWIDATSVSGDMSSELDPADGPPLDDSRLVELRAKTVSGDVQISRAG